MTGWIVSLRNSLACSVVLAGFVLQSFAQTAPPLLLRNPSISADKIAFLYADDPQLERAVSILLQQLKDHPVPMPAIPPYPNYHQHDDLGGR